MSYNNDTAFRNKYFIETDRDNASDFSWFISLGTNYTCYYNYTRDLTQRQKYDLKISFIRTIVYALSQPFCMNFFYLTIIIFFLHKFNFKKTVMKILLFHYILRSLGNCLNKLGEGMILYFTTDEVKKNDKVIEYTCLNGAKYLEMFPLRYFISRKLATCCWYVGEIIADWYPLIRTHAVIGNCKSMIPIYLTGLFFNLSKVVLIYHHFTLTFKDKYDEHGVYQYGRLSDFYDRYWLIQIIIIYASVIYEITIFIVLREKIFKKTKYDFGFMKKFRTISEYRIYVSLIFCIIFLPIVSISIFLRFYYQHKYELQLDLSFEETRQLIANVPYYMIFVDQIMLIYNNEKNTVDLSHLSCIKPSSDPDSFITSPSLSENEKSFSPQSPLTPNSPKLNLIRTSTLNTHSNHRSILLNSAQDTTLVPSPKDLMINTSISNQSPNSNNLNIDSFRTSFLPDEKPEMNKKLTKP